MRVLVVGEDGWVVWQKGNNETAGWVKTYTNTDVDPQTISGQGVAKNNSDSVIDSVNCSKTSGKVDVFVYYDGADDDVYTDQLADLTGCMQQSHLQLLRLIQIIKMSLNNDVTGA